LVVTHASGNVTLAPGPDLAVETGPVNLAFGDVDGDGKTDLAVPNQSSATMGFGDTVSILHNNS
jgi:hypothetical protein